MLLSLRPITAMKLEEQEIDPNAILEEFSIGKRNQMNQNSRLNLKSLTSHMRRLNILKRKFSLEMFFLATV